MHKFGCTSLEELGREMIEFFASRTDVRGPLNIDTFKTKISDHESKSNPPLRLFTQRDPKVTVFFKDLNRQTKHFSDSPTSIFITMKRLETEIKLRKSTITSLSLSTLSSLSVRC
jgi:hypothetical protein